MIAGGAVAYWFGAVLGCGAGAVKVECQGIGRLMMPVGAAAGAALGYFGGDHRKQPPSGVVYGRP